MEIPSCKTIGVIGESGSGKSVTAQSIMRIVPDPGSIVEGEILARTDAHGVIDLAQLPSKGSVIRSIRGREIAMIFVASMPVR